MVSPVFGFLPARAALLLTEKVPNPTNVSESPFLSAPEIESIIASNARLAAAFEISADSAMLSISSCLFNAHLFRYLFYCISSRLDFYSKALSGGQDKKNGGNPMKEAAKRTARLYAPDFRRLPMHADWVLSECPGSLSAFFR